MSTLTTSRARAAEHRSGFASLWLVEPIIDLRSAKLCGLEMRLGGHTIRDAVLASAHGPGASRAATLTILREAIDLARDLRAAGVRTQLAVDVSPGYLDAAAADGFIRLLGWFEVPPTQIRLEISERCPSDELLEASSALRHLSEVGVALTIDEFGDGLLSRHEIERLPADQVKIAPPAYGDHGWRRCEELAEWAHALGYDVVAERVDDPTWLARVDASGFDGAQGSAIAPPVEPKAVRAAVARARMRLTDPRAPGRPHRRIDLDAIA